MSKFKEGDEVQISDRSVYKNQGYKGGEKMRGVISPNTDEWYTVTWDNGSSNAYQDDDLEPYGATKSTSEPEPQRKFQVGDTVVGNSKATDRYAVTQNGWCGIVTEVHPDFFMAEGLGSLGIVNVFDLSYEYFDLAKSKPSEPQRKFKVGDTVVGNKKANKYGVTVKGWKGTVIKLGETYFNAEESSGTTFNDLSYECFDLVKSEPESTDREALLEEANRRYPIGTRYKELNDEGKATGALREAAYKAMWVARGQSIEVGYGYVYVKGKWAEIVNEDKYVVTQRIPSPSGGVYALTPGEIDISAAVIRNVWVDPSTKQLPDAQTPIIVSRSKNKSTIKVL